MSLTEQLAEALGVQPESVRRYRKQGLEDPRPGETIPQWLARAQEWRRANRKKTGPKPELGERDTEQAKWDVRYRKARALEKEHIVSLLAGKVHSVDLCERAQVQRLLELRNRLTMLPDKMAAVLVNVGDPEFIRRTVEDALRRALEDLGRVDRPPAEAVPGDGDGEETDEDTEA